MKPNNTGNRKLKQNAQAQDADNIQAITVFYMTLLNLYIINNKFHLKEGELRVVFFITIFL